MRTNRLIALLAVTCLAALALGPAAHADIRIHVNKSTQRMTVTVDGRQRYTWPVSTGRPGYDTPSGTFRPFRMDRNHRSEEYNNAPMPYSIFFTGSGDAVHGTYERGLGTARSHGCVRLSVKNAATLWKLVTRETMGATIVEISGSVRGSGVAQAARTRATPVATATQDRRTKRIRRRPLFPFMRVRR